MDVRKQYSHKDCLSKMNKDIFIVGLALAVTTIVLFLLTIVCVRCTANAVYFLLGISFMLLIGSCYNMAGNNE